MSAMKSEEGTSTWAAIILLLGSYAFGLNLHNVIHEFGHAVAIWLQGGDVTGFYFHPFDACLNFSTYVPNHVLLYAGGAFIGGASTIIFPIIAWRYRTPFVAPLVLACSAGLITTGRWMLVTPLSDVITDYSCMVDLGVSTSTILLVGFLYMITGIGVLILYLPLLGVSYQAGFLRRLLVLEIGFLPYRLAGSVFWLSRGSDPLGLAAAIGVSAAFIALVAYLSKWLPSRLRLFRQIPPARIRISHVAAAWVELALLILIMFLASVGPEGPK